MMVNSFLKGAFCTSAFFVGSEIIYQLYKRYIQNHSNLNSKSITRSHVLFFPDKDVACKDFFISEDGCFKSYCKFSHDKTSLSELYKHMITCKKSLDVCVFVLTCKDLADVLLRLHKSGVKVRLITDKDMLHCDGSQIWSLQKEGKKLTYECRCSFI